MGPLDVVILVTVVAFGVLSPGWKVEWRVELERKEKWERDWRLEWTVENGERSV